MTQAQKLRVMHIVLANIGFIGAVAWGSIPLALYGLALVGFGILHEIGDANDRRDAS